MALSKLIVEPLPTSLFTQISGILLGADELTKMLVKNLDKPSYVQISLTPMRLVQ